jgi:hypothetical protein
VIAGELHAWDADIVGRSILRSIVSKYPILVQFDVSSRAPQDYPKLKGALAAIDPVPLEVEVEMLSAA